MTIWIRDEVNDKIMNEGTNLDDRSDRIHGKNLSDIHTTEV